MECTTIRKDQMHAYVEGLLSDKDKVEIEKHLAACPECKMAFDDLRQAVHLVGKLDEVEPPAWLTQKIRAQIRAEQTPEAGLLKRLFHMLSARRFPVKITVTAAASLVIAVAALLVMKEMGPQIQPIVQPITQDVVTPQISGQREETPAAKSPEQKVIPPSDTTKLGKPLSAPSATGMHEAQPQQSQTIPADRPSREIKGADIVKEKREELREHAADEPPAPAGGKRMTAALKESAPTPASPPAPAAPAQNLRKASPPPGAMQAGKDRAESNDMFQAEKAQSQLKTNEGQAAEGSVALSHKKVISERYTNGRPKIVVTYRTTVSGLTKMMEERFDEAGMRDGLHTAYDEEGRITAEVLYRHGEIVSAREFLPDGTLRAGGLKRDWPWLKPGLP